MPGKTYSQPARGRALAAFALGAVYLLAGGTAQASNSDDAQGELRLLIDGEPVALESWERDYLYQALVRLQRSCSGTGEAEGQEVTAQAFRLTARLDNSNTIELRHDTRGFGNTGAPDITLRDDSGSVRLHHCEPTYSAPILAIMASKQHSVVTTQTYAASRDDPSAGTGVVEKAIEPGLDDEQKVPRLSAYEQNSLGWARDDNSVDAGYMDANMSFKFRAWQGGQDDRFRLFLAFSTRFSQYIETIESSPVVGKRYNPLAFVRTNVDSRQGYIDLGLAHESNGQSITTEEAYLAERQKYADSDDEPGFARYSISRGWDYVFADWTHCWLSCSDNYAFNGKGRFTTKFEFQYYLDDGPFQGEPEEYNDWEGGSERHRKEYDGVALTNDYRINSGCFGVDDLACSISWEYRTGYDGMFDNSTNRVQLSLGMEDVLVPIGIWMQTGHNSSLADYYTSVDSFGISLLFSNPY